MQSDNYLKLSVIRIDSVDMSNVYFVATVRSFGLNIDYFPTNFVVQNGIIFYIDYECNQYMDEWNFENWGIKYWSKTKEFVEYMERH